MHREPPPPTHGGKHADSMPQGYTPRERTHCPNRIHCAARAGPSLQAGVRIWEHPQQGHSPAVYTPQRPLPVSTPGCTGDPTPLGVEPAPLRHMSSVCVPASDCLGHLQMMCLVRRTESTINHGLGDRNHRLHSSRLVSKAFLKSSTGKVTGRGHTETRPLFHTSPHTSYCLQL